MSEAKQLTTTGVKWPGIALAVLGGLTAVMFAPQLKSMAAATVSSSEKVHGLVALAAIVLLVALRRSRFVETPMRGSLWGVVLIVLGLAVFAGLGMFPFRYGFARDIAIVPVLAGVVLAACGWRGLWLSLPLLLLLMLAIPIPTRLYLALTGPVQRAMLQVVAKILGALLGMDDAIHGTDLVVTGKDLRYVLGLGGARWPARLLMMFAVVGVFVTFARRRSAGRVVWMIVVAMPILLACDLLRLTVWSLVAVMGRMDPTSTLPRNISMVVAMLAAYGAFALAASARLNLFTETEAEAEPGDASPESPQPPPAPSHAPGFRLSRLVVPAVVLAVSAAGLIPAVSAVRDHYAKRSIPVRKTLREFDLVDLPSFRQGWETIPRPVPVEEIKTDEYCWQDLKPADATEEWDLAGISVTYNSKAGDTVAHTPDVCIRQAGASVSPGGDVSIDLPGVRPEYRRITGRVLLLRWPKFRQAVVFVFLAEGEFVTSRGQARRVVAWPGNRHTYHSLIMADARYPMGDPPDKAIDMCKTILRESLPVLLNEYYPKLEDTRGR